MNTYLLYDPALNGAYTQLILQQQYPAHCSLFAGTKDEGLDDVAPMLFLIDGAFADKVLRQPLIELAAAVVVSADVKMDVLAMHFRQFIYQTIGGREYFFRFWDARVLHKFLPTCSREQITSFFEGIGSLTMADEAEPSLATQYSAERGRLSRAMVPMDTIYGKASEVTATAAALPEQPTVQEPKPVKKGRTFLS